jgi:hypothetical protein
MIRPVALASFVAAFLATHVATAQVVYPTPQAPAIPLPLSDIPPPPPKPAALAEVEGARKAITRARPVPRPTSAIRDVDSIARRDSSALGGRFANPGGVGRYAEYYTDNTLSAAPPVAQARSQPRFDKGPGPTRADQLAAFQAGQQRTRNIQNNINAYGRPYGAYGAGFGFGFGLATGGLYGGGFR